MSIFGNWSSWTIFDSLNSTSDTLVAQLVKNPPAMWETWVRSLGWEDPIQKGMAATAKSLQSCPALCDPIDSRDSPGKNTGVGCHFLPQCMKVKSESEVAQSCLTLRDPMDCSLPGSSIHGIFIPLFWLAEFHGLYSPWGHQESETTERLSLSLSHTPRAEEDKEDQESSGVRLPRV